jgi:hypothetical protein
MLRPLLFALLLAPGFLGAQDGDTLPAYLLQVPASITTILVAETDAAALHRYSAGADGPEYRDARYMSVGQNGVGKNRAWDRKTPLGIYFVIEQLDTSKLHERYGPAAFPLDYPNVWDRANERGGDGIWIHGVAGNDGRRPPLDTDGCIALPNDELLALGGELVPRVTPVIITRSIQWQSRAQIAAVRAELSAVLATWAQSYRSGDLHRYFSMYSESFEYRGMSRDEWAALRLQTVGRPTVQGFEMQDVLLLADPEESGLYLSRFQQTIVDDGRTIVTVKRLYWRRTAEGELKIVAEDNG